ncbi:MAG: aminotransferase class V-fold PLP-dependent enzyme [Syntrophomonadaceae bacterium]|nr:aminotransferase class V-fold PLP-dependent enzyme [Syntrophomonadaceae bacterium]
MKNIYMDNAATSFPKPEAVYLAVDNFNRQLGANPGRGSSQQSLKSGSILVEAREALARLFNIEDSFRIAFTTNITEAINMGLKGIIRPGDHVITTSMEHNAVARPLYKMQQQGVEWTAVKCSSNGELQPEDIEKAIQANTRLICMLHASNLTGQIMPIEAVGRLAHAHKILFMVDSAQTAGVLNIDAADNIDILTFTGHKSLFGPQGTGGIYLKPGLDIETIKEGGTGSMSEHLEHPLLMPDHLESGTPNTPGIAGLLAGVDFIMKTGIANIRKHEEELTASLIQGLSEISGVKLYGSCDPHKQMAAVAFNIKGMDCGDLSLMLDCEFGIANRSGLHCAPLAHETIGTLESGTCRLSPGYFNTEQDIVEVIRAVHEIACRV